MVPTTVDGFLCPDVVCLCLQISIILHGELGMSETRELISEDDRPMFDRSSRDRFLLT